MHVMQANTFQNRKVVVYLFRTGKVQDEEAARKFAQEFNDMAEDQYSKDIEISWEYNTNITDYNQKRVVSYSLNHSATCSSCKKGYLP